MALGPTCRRSSLSARRPVLIVCNSWASRLALVASAGLLCAVIINAQDTPNETSGARLSTPRNTSGLRDPVAQLGRRLLAGRASLTYEPEVGLLPSVLRELGIPVSSQTLVFSKTSLQSHVINPRTPRALYFNDTVYVGYVPDGSLLELAAVDPRAGTVFYTITQTPGARPRLVINTDCVQCHATSATLGPPGLLLRSVFARPDGQMAPLTRSFLTDHRSPIRQRWGGWYVTGSVAGAGHMGNAFLSQDTDEASFVRNRQSVAAVTGRFDSARYLTRHSDVVALLVLDHQVQMHNLIGRLRSSANQGLPLERDVEELVRYALFADEAEWSGPVSGSSAFTEEFERLGPRDGTGRSLRQFDLKTRLFRYPCSFLLYSPEFAGLPPDARTAALARLDDVLSGRDRSEPFSRLTVADLSATRDILMETLPTYAAYVSR